MATLSTIRNNEPTTNASAARVDMKLEAVVIPVSDVDRAKEFYARLGWRLEAAKEGKRHIKGTLAA